MRFAVVLCLAAPAFASLVAGTAHAEIYMCKDASGHVITSDRLIPECAHQPVREYNANGVLRREIPAPLTPEQRRQQQLEAEKRKAELAVQAEQQKMDNAIMVRYHSEADIEAARKRALDVLEEQLRQDNASLATAQTMLRQSQEEAERFNTRNMGLPLTLSQRLSDEQHLVADRTKSVHDRQAEIARINTQFDQTLLRYRELSGKVVSQ